jgi:hypothetical protein
VYRAALVFVKTFTEISRRKYLRSFLLTTLNMNSLFVVFTVYLHCYIVNMLLMFCY